VIRRLFHGASAMSLLLCVAAIVLGARSFRVRDGIIWWKSDHHVFAASSQGRLWVFCWISKAGGAGVPARIQRETSPPQGLDVSREPWVIHYLHVPGLTVRTGAADIARTFFDVTISYWLAALAATVLPARWIVLYRGRWRRETRLHAGCCPACGYSLTGNTSGTCPECGTTIHLTKIGQISI
jgi:hypothetical protein